MFTNCLEHPEITYYNNHGHLDEDKPVCECKSCGGNICEGEHVYNLPDIGLVHEDCLYDYFKQYNCIADVDLL